MFKKLMLSLLVVSGSIGAFDNSDPNEFLREMNNPDEAPKGLTAEDFHNMANAVKKFVMGEPSLPEAAPSRVVETVAPINQVTEQIALSEVLSGANQALETVPTKQVAETLHQIAADVSAQGASQGVVETLKQTATQVGASADAAQAQNLLTSESKDALETSQELLKETVQESPKRFAVVREVMSNAWNSTPVQFTCDMFNPCAHMRAWKAMWQAGFKGALPTLWADHKAVIAGTAVIATAAYYAHKKGLFAKAKVWALDLKNQYYPTAV